MSKEPTISVLSSTGLPTTIDNVFANCTIDIFLASNEDGPVKNVPQVTAFDFPGSRGTARSTQFCVFASVSLGPPFAVTSTNPLRSFVSRRAASLKRSASNACTISLYSSRLRFACAALAVTSYLSEAIQSESPAMSEPCTLNAYEINTFRLTLATANWPLKGGGNLIESVAEILRLTVATSNSTRSQIGRASCALRPAPMTVEKRMIVPVSDLSCMSSIPLFRPTVTLGAQAGTLPIILAPVESFLFSLTFSSPLAS